MAGQAPSFWWQAPSWRSALLAPLACIYGMVAARNLTKRVGARIDVPVLCIGNYTVGGAGKTPTAIYFAELARDEGFIPGIVSRGFGGNYNGVHLVDPETDSAKLVGDEPLLLARHASVAVCSDRSHAAEFLKTRGCDFIIMDDGFQSARLYADYALLVVDASRGIGNGKIIPAGPLRAPLNVQMAKTDGILRIGTQNVADNLIKQAHAAGKPIFDAVLQASSKSDLANGQFLAFAGIGNPEKFFVSLRATGAVIGATREFADHHPFTPQDIAQLHDEAAANNLRLITTAKDYVRLASQPDIDRSFVEKLSVLDVELSFTDKSAAKTIFSTVLQRFEARQ
ncbi:tetraacyldisaccharide 4'-kinase [Paenochrobactrum sp. BZR 588]|uniref:tetraacyldisaccharide 4'-kinase n=1 Tax=Paenochrobactrum TaxID=999488 RepID=UPI0035BBBF35